ncbi:hypothetical protein HU200_037792 [Digitaria exilis]|uniref:Uncharacterized protein n=1 Tax=Digitaria exilis TaxID=1010633 RepID=A0A835BPH1_9POAL|nr:hypothetical protein HU200_037792 [Digitaria exilis]
MEPRMQRAFAAMRDLEKGRHRQPRRGPHGGALLAPRPGPRAQLFLRNKIETTLDSILAFSQDVISGKVAAKFSVSICLTYLAIASAAEFRIATACLVCSATLAYLAPCIRSLISRVIGQPQSTEGISNSIAIWAVSLQILSIGIGGSALGPQFVSEALAPDNPPLKVFTLRVLQLLKKSLCLDNTCQNRGMISRRLLVGAALMDEETRNTVVKKIQQHCLHYVWIWLYFPYKDSLLLLSRYLQQLVMESLGKEYDLDGNRVNQGLTVYGNKGSTDPACGTRSALYANDRESISVTVQDSNS